MQASNIWQHSYISYIAMGGTFILGMCIKEVLLPIGILLSFYLKHNNFKFPFIYQTNRKENQILTNTFNFNSF